MFFILCIYFCLCWVFMVTDKLSLVAAHGLLIAVISLAMEHRLQALRLQKLQHMAHGLSCSPACGILPARDWTHVPCIGRWILNQPLELQGSPRVCSVCLVLMLSAWWGVWCLPQTPHEVSIIIMPILQRKRLRYREVKKLAGGSVTGAKEAKVESRQPDYRAWSSSSYNILPVPHEVHHGVGRMKHETPPRPTQLMSN